MSGSILVAGATGTNGREVVRRLVERSLRPRVLVRSGAAALPEFDGQIDVAHGDLQDRDTLKRAMVGIKQAYIVTSVQPDTVELFSNFFEAAKSSGVERVIKFSGLGADTQSASTVIRQHGESDDILIRSGLDYAILRPNSFHQNMLLQSASIKRTGLFHLPLGDARQSTIDVRDIAEITVKVLTEPGHSRQIYDLTGPESLSFEDVASCITAVAGHNVRYVSISAEAAERALVDAGVPDWNAAMLAEIQSLFAAGRFAAVDATAQRLLKRPLRTFASFAKDHAAAFR